MAETAIIDIELDFLNRLKQADQSLASMINNANKLTDSLKKAFNSVDGTNIDLISRMAAQWEALGSQKLRLNVDTSKIEELTSLLDNTVQVMQAFSSSGIELFDTDKVYATTKSVFELNKELSAVEKKITELKAKWDGDIFEPPMNEKTGKPWSRGSKAYKAAKAAWESDKEGRVDKDEIAAELSLLAEKKAILQEELRWANMTQDERVEYTKKKLKQELNEEQKHNKDVIAEYRKTITEMLGIMRETDRLNKKNEGGVIDPEIQQLNARFAQLNQERIAMEENYGAIIVKVAEEANAKAVKIYAERKLTEERLRKDAEDKEWQAYLSSPEGALQLASEAKSWSEQEKAQKYVKTALKNTTDPELIEKLEAAYTKLRIAIEKHEAALKNEQSLQPTVRNEYVRLLKELEKVQEARLRLSDTDAFASSDPKAESDYNALLARERDIQTKIRQIRDNSNGLLAEADNQYRADKAQRDLAETERVEKEKTDKIKARYKEVLDELRQLEKEQNRIEDLGNKYGDDFQSYNATTELYRRQRELNDERLIIEGRHQDKISDIQEEEGKKRIKDEVDRAERAARLSIEARKREGEKAEKDRSTYSGAMAYSRSTRSIKEQIQAIKYLKEARENLNRGDFSNENEYRNALNRITLEIDRQEKSIKNLKLETEAINPISGQLKTALTNVFGVAAVKGYVNQLIRIRGEFELQQRSLQVLLRNKDEANRLWEQTVKLAVKSPYRVDELVTATKQLAAYRVETNKLHSTTQMLADLSSGLGVDIQRLILAFGQVKAANFLRGTELRQFSEAGINILDELAEHYSNLEGRIVSVGDVFDRVSKRMVSFADVETVLQGMTGEGGQFYKMQEQQAETLRGQMMNLKDSVLLMYNEIGEMSDGVLKGSIAAIRDIVENWRSYANIIATVVGAIAGYKSIVLLSKGAMALYNFFANAAAVVTVKFGNSASWAAKRVHILNKTMRLNPFVRAIAIITSLVAAIGGLFVSFDKVNKGVKSHVQILDENAIAAKNAAAGIKELTDERNELLKVENRSEEQEKRLNDITSARNRLLGELAEKNQEYAKSLKLVGDDSDKMSAAIEEQNAKIEAQLSLAYKLSKADWEKSSDAKKAETTKIGTSAVFKSMYDGALDLNAWVSDSPTAIIENAINDSQGDIEVAIKTMFENLRGYTREEQIKMIKGALEDTPYGEIVSDYLVAEDLLSSIVPTLENDAVNIAATFAGTARGEIIKSALQSADEEIKNNALTELQGYFKKEFISQAIPDTAQDEIKKAIAKAFGLEDGWFEAQVEKQLSAWQKGYNALLDALTKGKNIPSLTPVTATTDIKDQVRLLNELKEAQEAIITQYADQQKYKNVMLPIHSKEDADNAKFALDVINELLKALGQLAKGGRSKDTRYTNLIKTVNDVYSAFDKLEEKFSDTIATEMLWRDYSEAVDTAFKKVGRSAEWVREKFGDLNTKESLKAALDWIAENATTSEAKLQAKTASAKIGVDIEIETRDEAFDELNRKVEDMFSGYELSIELEKLNVPKEFAKEFFSIDSMDISELRKKVLSLKPEFEAKGALDEYQDFLDKLDDMETKEQQERLKKYLAFTRDMVSDRGKILINSARDLAEIEKAFTITNTMAFDKGLISKETKKTLDETGKTIKDLLALSDEDLTAKWGFTPEAIDNLRTYNELFEQQKNIAINASKENKDKQLKEQDWKDFQKSEVFVALFQDVDNASEKLINHMLDKLQKFRESWKDLEMEEVKEIVNKIRELELALSERRPLKLFRELSDEIKDIYAGTTDIEGSKFAFTNKDALKMYGDEFDYSNAREALEIELLARQGNLQVAKEALATAEAEYDALVQQKDVTDEQLLAGQQKVANAKEEVDDNQQLVTQAQSLQGKDKQRTAALVKMTGAMQKANKIATTLYESFSELYEALGGDNELVSIFSEMGLNMMDAVSNTILMIVQTEAATIAAHGFGAAMKSATGIIGWALLAIEMLVMALTAAFKAHDAQLQKQIEEEQERVDELKLKYEELEKQIEKAYSAGDFQRLHNEMQKNINEQITSLREMQALEEDKKKTDDEKIEGWEDEIRDLYEQLEENMEEMFSTATDGILDNVLDASRNFVDAWLDAFQETGTGIHALEDTFAEMMASILKQQAAMNIVGPYVDELTKRMKQYVNADDMVFSKEDASRIKSYWNSIQGPMNESLENFFTAFEGLLNTGSELSDLEKGIQGMTEDQAEVLAAYWNSCRFMLANIDTNVAKIASGSAIETRSSDSPLYSDLKTEMIKHTAILTTIEDLFRSVIGNESNSSHSGAYIKVLM